MTASFFEAIQQGDQATIDQALASDPSLLGGHDRAGLSPVLAAAYGGHPRLAGHLADRIGPTGLSIFEAAVVGQPAVVRRKLAEGWEIEERGVDGYTPLHLAAYFGQLEVARMLLESGADPNAVASNDSRVTPLHSAVSARHRDLAGLLLALGATPNAIQKGGWTPLHAAAHNGDVAIVDLLLLRGADPTRRTDDGRSPPDMADEGGHASLADVLREASPD